MYALHYIYTEDGRQIEEELIAVSESPDALMHAAESDSYGKGCSSLAKFEHIGNGYFAYVLYGTDDERRHERAKYCISHVPLV